MGYCEATDLIKMLPEAQLIRLTDDEGAGAYNAARVTEAIDTASDEIDTYIGTRYALPVDAPPAILTKLCVDMAVYNLYSRVLEDIPDTRATRYKDAVRFLEKVAEGKITLGIQPPPAAPAAESHGAAQAEARTQMFDADTLDTY